MICKNFKFIEFDTEILNKNLKKLKVYVDSCSSLDSVIKGYRMNVDEISQILKIFPNIEKLTAESCFFNLIVHPLKFFVNLNKMEKLNCLKVSGVALRHCPDEVENISNQLTKLSRKVNNMHIDFIDYFENREIYEEFTYEKLKEKTSDYFKFKETSSPCRMIDNRGTHQISLTSIDDKDKQLIREVRKTFKKFSLDFSS